jgi:hypothetical protein
MDGVTKLEKVDNFVETSNYQKIENKIQSEVEMLSKKYPMMDDPDFQKAIQSAVYRARKADVSNPQPDLLPVLEKNTWCSQAANRCCNSIRH